MSSLIPDRNRPHDRLLATLTQLLALQATSLQDALTQAAEILSSVLRADKIDAFVYDPATAELVALGVSDTPMGRRQRALGLDRLPIDCGGNVALVYQTGSSFRNGHLDKDPRELPAVVHELGAHSIIATPLHVGSTRTGVLQGLAVSDEWFSDLDLDFLEAVARWVGTIAQRADLLERLAATQAPHEQSDSALGWQERLIAWRIGELEAIARESQIMLDEYATRATELTQRAQALQEALQQAEERIRQLEGRDRP